LGVVDDAASRDQTPCVATAEEASAETVGASVPKTRGVQPVTRAAVIDTPTDIAARRFIRLLRSALPPSEESLFIASTPDAERLRCN
jgi:hypothetical protein